LTATS